MSEDAKIALSEKELELVCSTDWILTKHSVIEKVYQLFGSLALSMQGFVEENKTILPAIVSASNPKISKGENYLKLPYVMLDYPRHFTKEDSLAIRTLFWWGNFFSINLHLSGSSKQQAVPALLSRFSKLQHDNYWICVHEDPWQHHFNEDNYLSLRLCRAEEFAAILYSKPFVKLAKKIHLSHWNNATFFISYTFEEMLMMVEISSPGDEKDPLPGIPIIDSDP